MPTTCSALSDTNMHSGAPGLHVTDESHVYASSGMMLERITDTSDKCNMHCRILTESVHLHDHCHHCMPTWLSTVHRPAHNILYH